MEQGREVRDLEQVEDRDEVVVVAKVVVAGEVVLRQDRVVTAFAPTVVKKQLINWGPPVMSRIAQSVAPP